MGLRLSEAKTMVTHIEVGLDFLGWRIQRHRKRGTTRHYVYTYPAKKALKAITAKVKTLCRTDVNRPLPALLHRLNPALRGWCAYFRPGVSSSTFQYLSKIAWYQVTKWIKRKHRRMTWKELRRRYCGGGWWPTTATGQLFDPGRVRVTRYRYRGTAIPRRGPPPHEDTSFPRRDLWRARCSVTGTPGSGGGPEKPTNGNIGRALRVDLTATKANDQSPHHLPGPPPHQRPLRPHPRQPTAPGNPTHPKSPSRRLDFFIESPFCADGWVLVSRRYRPVLRHPRRSGVHRSESAGWSGLPLSAAFVRQQLRTGTSCAPRVQATP
jgi:RNA-directed DNA polymerase